MLKSGTSGWTLLALMALLGACGSDPASGDESRSGDDSDDDDSDTPAKKDAGTGNKTDKKDAGTSATRDSGAKPSIDAGSASGGAIPCAVAKVVEANCQSCHGAKPISGAPFSLLTLADFQAAVPGETGQLVHQAAYAAVTKTGPGSMPPASVDPLNAADKKTLGDWLKAGAQGGAACTEGSQPPKGDAGTAVPITGGSGGAHIEPVEYDDPQLKCYEFRSFTAGNKKQPYSTPTTPDFYVAFNFNPPWQGTQYVRSFRTLIDNSDVIHHWLFFQQALLTGEGVTPNALGAHPDGQMLAGWAPGGSDLYFDPDVAFEVPGDVSYQLEVHYNNKTGRAAPDASGVELCVTPTKPTHVAALSWVGTDAIAGTEATGHCAPETGEDIHLIQAQPHMHTKGRHMKVEHVSGGKTNVIHDKAFDFNFQRGYIMDTLIKPGDELYTTCTYSEFATFGKGTSDEMCYFFSIYWPKGTLQSTGVGTFIHGVNSCIDI